MRSWTKILGVMAGVGLLTAGGCGVNKKDHEALKNENVELRERMASIEKGQTEAASREAALQQQIADRENRISQLEASRQPIGSEPRQRDSGGGGGETFVLKGDVAFASGQATLTSAARKELDGIASKIRSTHGAGASIRVEGHTDSDPIKKSKWGTNEALSQARADAVAAYLESKGFSSVSSVGRGSSMPKATKAASRRVEIKVR